MTHHSVTAERDDDCTSADAGGPPISDRDDFDSIASGDPSDAESSESRSERGEVVDTTQPRRLGTYVSCGMVAALAALVAWLAFGTVHARQAERQHDLFIQVARQGAINLTTIDYTHADTDVQRILDGATGAFYDDFKQRSTAFVDVVRRAQSKTEGTVTEAAVESQTSTEAQVLVAVSVKTTTAATPDQPLRNWRMRVDVQRVDDDAKVTKVEFVP